MINDDHGHAQVDADNEAILLREFRKLQWEVVNDTSEVEHEQYSKVNHLDGIEHWENDNCSYIWAK